ncbi:hypothetical protein WJX73_003237 [Symbiochloris irregularis]|uniref:Uncharacterized protein n=1 Tax=Symbiochloris irregularis TaxID=706552 RepID=A0AAW1PA82_9CHLO
MADHSSLSGAESPNYMQNSPAHYQELDANLDTAQDSLHSSQPSPRGNNLQLNWRTGTNPMAGQRENQAPRDHSASGSRTAPPLSPPPAQHYTTAAQQSYSPIAQEGDGADVAVKEVQLGGGQRATIIMEDGRIKRIVSGNGQVAELRWQSSQPSPQANHSRLPMSISLTQDGQETVQSPQPSFGPRTRRSQPRNLSGGGGSFQPAPDRDRRGALYTAPSRVGGDSGQGGRKSRSMTEMRMAVEDGRRAPANYRPGMQRASSLAANPQRLVSAPVASRQLSLGSPDAEAVDMPTIMESTSQVPRDWNPMTNHWLPPNMTRTPGRRPAGSHPSPQTPSTGSPDSEGMPGSMPGVADGRSSSARTWSSSMPKARPARQQSSPINELGGHRQLSMSRRTRSRALWTGPIQTSQSIQDTPRRSLEGGRGQHHYGDQQQDRPKKRGFWSRLKRALFPSLSTRARDPKSLPRNSGDTATSAGRQPGSAVSNLSHMSQAQPSSPEDQYKQHRQRSGSTRAQSRRETLSPQWSREVLPQENYALQQQQQEQRQQQRQQQRLWSRESNQDPAVSSPPIHPPSTWSQHSQDFNRAGSSGLRASGRAASRPLDASPARTTAMNGVDPAQAWRYAQTPPSRQPSNTASAFPSETSPLSNAPSLGNGPSSRRQVGAVQPRRASSRRLDSTRADSLQSIGGGVSSWQDRPDPAAFAFNAPPSSSKSPAVQHNDENVPEGGNVSHRRERRRREGITQEQASAAAPGPLPRLRAGMAGKWRKNAVEGTSGSQVDDLLQMSSLQRLAREKVSEMEIVELEDALEIIWHICLNNGASRISKAERFDKSGEVMEGPRRDGRPGILRSQLTITPEGHVHIRSLQNEPFSAVFHDRFKLSTGGRRIKFDQKFQLLAPGVLPVKHFSIWHRIVEE